MKLLGWVHCKFKNNIRSGLSKGKTTGNPGHFLLPSPWDDQDDYQKANHSFNSVKQSRQKDFNQSRDCSDAERARDEVEGVFEDTFPGFLAIGTLSIDLPSTEPATPTFVYPDEETTTQGETYETLNDIEKINNELEKFLKAEALKEGVGESRRVSQASTITLTEKEMLELSKDVDIKALPLQGYLLGSSIDISETKTESRKEKASLQALFHKSRGMGGNSIRNSEMKQDFTVKQQSTHMMKKILQKFQSIPRKNAASFNEKTKDLATGYGAPTDAFMPGRKFKKIKKLFQRKVHPEDSTTMKKLDKLSEYEKGKSLNSFNSNYVNKNINQEVGKQPLSNQNDTKHKEHGLGSMENISSSINEEHWIKTDENYLVLELGLAGVDEN